MDENKNQLFVEQARNVLLPALLSKSILGKQAKLLSHADNLPFTRHGFLLASVFHHGQVRKTGEPFITHPLRVAQFLVSVGILDDATLASALLHDVLEECQSRVTASALETAFSVNNDVVETVKTLTKHKRLSNDNYYATMACSPKATLVKIADRCHNLATMTGAFLPSKMREYIDETEQFVIPLCSHAYRRYPQYTNAVRLIGHRMKTMVSIAKWELSQTKTNVSSGITTNPAYIKFRTPARKTGPTSLPQ